MKKILPFSAALLLHVLGFAQAKPSFAFDAVKLTVSELPKTIHFKGNLAEAYKWNDKLGENILILSLNGPYDDTAKNNQEDEGQSAEIFAFHFCKKDSAYKLLWKLTDQVKFCSVDITVDFIKGATVITDLDKDDIAETIVQYKLACRGDVSPSHMKLIMHEDTVKYALRGNMWTKQATEGMSGKFLITEKDVNLEKLKGYKGPDEDYIKAMGRYESEKDFKNAPQAFIEFARKQWLKFAIEKFE